MQYIIIILNLLIVGLLFSAQSLGIGSTPTQNEYIILIPAIISLLGAVILKNKRVLVASSVGMILAASYLIPDNSSKNLIAGDIITIGGVIELICSFFFKKNTPPKGEYAKSVEVIEV